MTRASYAKASGRREIHCRVEGSGPFVTLIHGVGAILHSWDEVAARMWPHYSIVRMDLAGHGQFGSITGNRTLEDLEGDVRLVWDHLGLKSTHLGGFSLGGLIAQSLALSDPGRIACLIILSAVAGRTPEERAKVVDRLTLLQNGGIGALVYAGVSSATPGPRGSAQARIVGQ